MKTTTYLFSITLLIALFTSTSPTSAQILPKFGVKGGANFSTFYQTDLDGYYVKPGVLIGAFAELSIPMSPISFQPELMYAQFGAGTGNDDVSLDLNYIQVPVLVRYKLSTPVVKPVLFAGPYANILISSEIDGDGSSLELDEVTKGSAYGLVLGAGIDTRKFQIDVRVSTGFTDVFEEEFSDDEKNLGIALTFGVKL